MNIYGTDIFQSPFGGTNVSKGQQTLSRCVDEDSVAAARSGLGEDNRPVPFERTDGLVSS